MVPIVWNAQNEAVIELCQDVTDNALFGYRLPGQDSCHLAAIMIRTQPGNSYRLTIRNNSSDPTNLHTHGLHISGDGNADNPFRSVESGGCIKYYWDIPANHMGGTHWMHSHHKNFGYTQVRQEVMIVSRRILVPVSVSCSKSQQEQLREQTLSLDLACSLLIPTFVRAVYPIVIHVRSPTSIFQVRGGAVAMFIVEENQELLDNVDANSKPGIEQWLSNELLLLASRTLLGHRGNGLESNRYNVTLGEWYRLRIVGVEMDGNSWRLRMPFGCTVLPVAHDGVWRFLVPGPPPASSNEFRMTPAGRLDVAIRCNRRGTFQITAVSDVIASSNVATLNVVSGTTTSATPFTSSNGTWAPKRPAYLEDLIGAGIPDQLYNISVFSSSINGVNFAKNPSVMEVLPYGTLQEWTIINAADPHSFHQHVHHFQVVDCPGFSAGEFYDTIQPNTSTPCIVRTRLNNYGGNLFFHCHTITHSEMGAAALFNVTGGGIVNPDTDMDEFVC
jgi:FtsP/CotA-like multicopper oxidase with cupredoxin domain